MYIKQFLGIVASFTSIIAFIPYVIDILKNKTKPHAFSWFIWSLLAAIVFMSQVVGGGGAGSWLMGTSSTVCFIIFLLSLKKGTKDIQIIDWISLGGALLAMILWIITKTPFLSVILITITDALAFFPTIRKSFSHPNEETILMYLINTLKFMFGILATNNYSIITVFYPSYLIIANGFFALYLYIRRIQLKRIPSY